MAAGVASESAHGQVTISTATATIRAWAGLCGHHQAAARPAAINTPSKKGRAMRSANKASRGLANEAWSIKATIWA